MKKRFVCVVLLVCLIVLSSVLFSACSTPGTEPLPQNSFIALISRGNTITTPVKLTDITLGEMAKLYSFYHYGTPSDFRYDEIFRNTSLIWISDYFWLASRAGVPYMALPEDGRDSRLRATLRGISNDYDVEYFEGAYKRAETLNEQEKKDVVFFDGRKTFSLSDNEIIVSKYVYLTLYADQYGLEIDEETLHRIIDDEDVFAKYVILRNCPTYGNSFYIDGVAMEYYGLDKQVEEKPIYVQTQYVVYDEREERANTYTPTKKVVGYYDVDCSDLAGHKTDINNVYGYNVDGYRNPELYQELFARDPNDLHWLVTSVLLYPKLSEDGTKVTFLEPYGILNYDVDVEMLALWRGSIQQGTETKEVTGTYRQKLEKASCIYGN